MKQRAISAARLWSPHAHAAIGRVMRSFHRWHTSRIAVLAVAFFSSAPLANSAEPPAQAAVKGEALEGDHENTNGRKREQVQAGTQGEALEAAIEGRTAAPAPSPQPPAPSPVHRPGVPGAPPSTELSAAAPARKKVEKLRFQFRYQPWKDVLDWFAQQADLSLVVPETIPQGTFNYSDTRDYTPAEAIDLLNTVLQTKGYTLVRRDRMLILINTEDPIPPNLVSTVPVESLDGRGESELVNVHFKLIKIRPEDIEAEVPKLLGAQGSVKGLAKSQELSVTDTVGRLRTVRAYLNSIEGPEGTLSSGLKTFRLKHARPEEVLSILRQLLEIPEDKNAAADGSIRIVQETGSDRLLVSGRPDKVARASEIIEKLDTPASGGEGTGRRSHVRTLPMSEESARAALLRIEQVWPSMRPNKIHVIGPPAGSDSTVPPGGGESPRALPDRSHDAKKSGNITTKRDEHAPHEGRPADPPGSREETPRQTPPEGPQAAPPAKVTMAAQGRSVKLFGARILWVADQVEKLDAQGKSPAPIIVIPGPNGLTITSEDLEALDEFERLLGTAAGGSGSGPLKVFFLKYAKAQDVAELLDKFLAGGASGSEGSSGHKALVTGPIKITPEPRLNALMVLANRADQDTVEQLLAKVFDLKESPEDVAVAPKPRMIAVAYARAKDIAEVLRQVYADRLTVAQGQDQQGRGGFVPFFMRMGGGGPGGGFGGGNSPGSGGRGSAGRRGLRPAG